MLNSIAARVTLRGVTAPARQLILTWLAGSLTMGTVAALFLSAGRVPLRLRPALPLPGRASPHRSLGVGGKLGLGGELGLGRNGLAVPGIDVVKPVAALPVLAITAVILLVVLLFAALVVIAWDSPGTSWLPADARGWLWWAALTGVLGLAGWFFAATVTFGANFGPTWQAVLGYAGGGLPFALMAALLQAPRAVNLVAGTACVGLVVLGFVLVAVRDRSDPNALSLSYVYLRYLFSPASGGIPVPIPAPTGILPTAYP